MKKTANKILSIILTVCMLLTAMTGALSMDAFASGSDPDMIRLHTTTDWVAYKYITGWDARSAGNYEATLKCNLLSGSMPTIRIGSDTEAESIGVMTNYTSNYDSFNHVYKITFTLSSSWTGALGWYIATEGRACDCFLAQPEIYLLDGSGNRTGDNIAKDFCSDNYVSARTRYKWFRKNQTSSNLTTSSYDASIFAVQDSVTFNGTWTKLYYCTNSRYFYAATYKLTMDMKVISGTPTVNVKNNDSSGTAVTVTSRSYDEENFKFELLFTVADYGDLNVVFEIGNEGTAANFTVASPRCYRLDSGNPVSKGIFAREFGNYDDSYNPSDGFSGHTDKWCRRGSGRTCNTLTTSTFSHEISGTDKSLYVRQLNNVNALLTTQTTVESGQTYLVECDWKAYGGAMPRAFISYNNGSWTDITSSATADTGYITDGASGSQYYESNTGAYSFANMGATQGHYAVKVTIGSTDVWASNFKLGFGATVYNWSAANYGRGEFYITNVSLKKVGGTGANLIKDPTFKSLSGDYTNAGSFSTYWNKEISRSGSGDRKYFSSVKFIEVPASLYTNAGITENPKMITFNGGNWEGLYQGLELEPSTSYTLTYQAISVNGGLVQTVDYFNPNTNPETGNVFGWQHILKSGSTDANGNATYTFTTPASSDVGMSSNTQELYRIIFNTNTNSPEQRFNLANVCLCKTSGGPNLISNGNFYFGTETTVTDLHTEYTNYESYFKVHYANSNSLLGWRLVTNSEDEHKLEQNQGIVVSAYKETDFPAPITTQAGLNETLSQLYHIVLGTNGTLNPTLPVSPTNPYQNVDCKGAVNESNPYDIVDIVLLDMASYESVTNNTIVDVDKAANDILAKYTDGTNTTNLSTLAAAGMLATAVTGKTYYFDSNYTGGSSDGTVSKPYTTLSQLRSLSALTSGDCVLFKCNSVFRNDDTDTSDDHRTVLSTVEGVTYGAYGSGAKPVFSSSYRNWAGNATSPTRNNWSKVSGNIYRADIRISGSKSSKWDVGQIYYVMNGSTEMNFGNMKLSQAACTVQGDFYVHTWDSSLSDGSGGEAQTYVYMCSPAGDPDTVCSDIELAQKITGIDLKSGVTLNNLCVNMVGNHGIRAGSACNNTRIYQCEVSGIGGCWNNGVRYGNGIQYCMYGSNNTVKNCCVHDVFDSGITFQSYHTYEAGTWDNINFVDNLVERCFMGIEFFIREESLGYNDKIQNTTISGNVIRSTGGWGYTQRIGNPDKIGKWACSGIKCGQEANYADSKIQDMYITNNIIYGCYGPLIWMCDADSTTHNGLHISGNSWYQYDYGQETGETSIALTNFKTPARIYGSSTGALRAAIVNVIDTAPKVVRFIGDDAVATINLPVAG